MNSDIKPYTGFMAVYMRDIEPRRLELAEHMGILTKIEVKEYVEPRQHVFESGWTKALCYCADCYGDFSGASDDGDGR